MDKEMIEHFYRSYLPKEETKYRLPMRTDMEMVWSEEMAFRKENAHILPLHSFDGENYWFNQVDEYLDAADVITEMARLHTETSVFAELDREAVMDEAYYSSAMEGAYSTREKARSLLESEKPAADQSERMILNNYNALRFVMEHLEEPVTEALVLRIGEILTEGTLDEEICAGYRENTVYVKSHTGEIVYTAPEACHVKPMMEELIAYINQTDIHPIEKAVVAHVYFVTVHPFLDGNGRTARALTYLILLQAGYGFFRYVPISGILAEKRGQYYKALKACQNTENGYDFTYFVTFYTRLLADTVEGVKNRIHAMELFNHAKKLLNPERDARAVKGAAWMVHNDIETITSEKWKKKFGISFETARTDLMKLVQAGFLEKRTEGRKMYFDRKQ